MRFVAFLNAYSQGLSGGDACFLNVAKEIGQKHDLVIVTSRLGMELCKRSGVRAKFELTSGEKKFGNVYLAYLRRILGALHLLWRKKLGVEIVYSSSDFLPDVLPAWWLKIGNRKSLWVQKIFHIIPRERVITYFFQRASLFLIRRWADLVITDNAGLREELVERYGFRPQKVRFVPPGVGLKAVAKVVPAKERYDGLFVGQLRRSKGIFDLVPIWREVVQAYSKATLGIVGKDIQGNEAALRSEVLKNGLEKNIFLLGFKPKNEEVYALMKSSRVLLLPSYEEGFGMVAVESLACGIPVVAYRLPALEENFGSMIEMVAPEDTGVFAKVVVDQLARRSRQAKKVKRELGKFDTISVVNRELKLIDNAYQSAR